MAVGVSGGSGKQDQAVAEAAAEAFKFELARSLADAICLSVKQKAPHSAGPFFFLAYTLFPFPALLQIRHQRIQR